VEINIFHKIYSRIIVLNILNKSLGGTNRNSLNSLYLERSLSLLNRWLSNSEAGIGIDSEGQIDILLLELF
jgi:hypothetical protein